MKPWLGSLRLMKEIQLISPSILCWNLDMWSTSHRLMIGNKVLTPEHTTAGTRANASKTKVMLAIISDEQRQAALLDDEPLGDFDKFKHLGSMFIANVQDANEIRSITNLALPQSLICNRVFGRAVNYHCAQRAGSTRQRCVRFGFTVARREGCWWSTTMTASVELYTWCAAIAFKLWNCGTTFCLPHLPGNHL